MTDRLSKWGLVCLLSVLIVSGFGVAPVSARSMSAYTVRPGDTLIGIAARHGLSLSQLARANGLPWNAWVYVGQRLIMPASSMVYTVQWGDTLNRLAHRFGTTVQAIVTANGLRSTKIYVGQRIMVPGRDSARGNPTIAISPTSGPAGTLVEARASGFPSHASISVGLGPQNSEFSEVARGTTDGNGQFIVQAPVGGAAGMTWVFSASAGDRHATSPPFRITRSTSKVAISPITGPSGTLVQVIGSGFPSSSSVSVGVGPEGSEFEEIVRGATDADGRVTLSVPVRGAPGMGLLVAVAADGQPGVRSPDLFRIAY